MLTSFLLISAILLAILTVSVLHLPLWLRRLIYYTPAWAQSAIIHFAYGGWVGGVTGHIVGGLLSVPWFFICRYWLQPRIGKEMALAWERNPVRETWRKLRRQDVKRLLPDNAWPQAVGTWRQGPKGRHF